MSASRDGERQKYSDEYFDTLPASVRANWDMWLVYGLCNPQDYGKLKAYNAWLEKYQTQHWKALNKMQENYQNRKSDPLFTAALNAVADAIARRRPK